MPSDDAGSIRLTDRRTPDRTRGRLSSGDEEQQQFLIADGDDVDEEDRYNEDQKANSPSSTEDDTGLEASETSLAEPLEASENRLVGDERQGNGIDPAEDNVHFPSKSGGLSEKAGIILVSCDLSFAALDSDCGNQGYTQSIYRGASIRHYGVVIGGFCHF